MANLRKPLGPDPSSTASNARKRYRSASADPNGTLEKCSYLGGCRDSNRASSTVRRHFQ